MAGRSLPNRALTASAPCPAGTLGTLTAACACAAPGLAGSDCSSGPFGAADGGADGTSRGGRSVNELSKLCVLPKNCALAAAASAASQTPVAKTSWLPLPDLVPPILMGRSFRPQ